MRIQYPEIGICGLSCRLCPQYHTEGKSRCGGCKTESRMGAGCPFITCALKKGIEFCWNCKVNETCEKWAKHRESGKKADSFKSYQKLKDDIAFIQKNGLNEFEKTQKTREHLLNKMLGEFNEGRSKSYYCIAATVMEIRELEEALKKAHKDSQGLGIKEKARVLHSELDDIARQKNYYLKLRK
ncbi:MAG: DUF3795 domain-containing protein [Methanoregulaceae archaeon]|nr:MAG: DUF3795 domain-containing protein [Methanoregulaceae archaeon]